MTGDDRLTAPMMNNRVSPALGTYVENGTRRDVAQVDASLDLRRDDIAIDGIIEAGVRTE